MCLITCICDYTQYTDDMMMFHHRLMKTAATIVSFISLRCLCVHSLKIVQHDIALIEIRVTVIIKPGSAGMSPNCNFVNSANRSWQYTDDISDRT